MKISSSLLAIMPIAALAADGDILCHDKGEHQVLNSVNAPLTGIDSDVGKTCKFFGPDLYMGAAEKFCRMFIDAHQTPVGGEQYPAKFLALVDQKPDMNYWQIFHGEVKINNNFDSREGSGNWNWINYDRCIEYFPRINERCDGFGGTYIGPWGEVSGICIRA
ncbi:hypothetical protein BDV95DRAFT_592886 [Massariosphaeria phaeospora]|uniref:Uncharacterized protein n=1 Tax=Massariosphaeria phaeospora TaxID=100035 RepID=A0A7C8I8T8_9PLEO|nr:hypothetical protein BDV95DRAFT_592886 [Massariosphaeria phaeospora]